MIFGPFKFIKLRDVKEMQSLNIDDILVTFGALKENKLPYSTGLSGPWGYPVPVKNI